jgi:hypothetical protein
MYKLVLLMLGWLLIQPVQAQTPIEIVTWAWDWRPSYSGEEIDLLYAFKLNQDDVWWQCRLKEVGHKGWVWQSPILKTSPILTTGGFGEVYTAQPLARLKLVCKFAVSPDRLWKLGVKVVKTIKLPAANIQVQQMCELYNSNYYYYLELHAFATSPDIIEIDGVPAAQEYWGYGVYVTDAKTTPILTAKVLDVAGQVWWDGDIEPPTYCYGDYDW